MDLMMSKDPRDLESVKENLVPWLVKGGWQDGVRAKWNPSKPAGLNALKYRCWPLAVLNHSPDPLAAALAKSTVASLSLTTTEPEHQDYFESTNPTSPSSPGKTPGETLVDFKSRLSGGVTRHIHSGRDRKSYQRPAPGDELRCAMVIYERPVPEVPVTASVQNQKGRPQVVEKEKDVEPPLMRGNTVAGYWELSRQVSPSSLGIHDR
jgi:translation initiation factor eIF-2B subunit gamma